jgi:DNA-binding transcriptional MerR regulator
MDPALTIDELAHETGMTVRNIRAHQSRGLLPPPNVKGRTGYYGPEHRARVELIKEMQAAGFNLAAIKRMLESAPQGAGEELLRFERLLMAPWDDSEPEVMELSDLTERFGRADAKAFKKAEELGLIRDLGEGRYELPSPAIVKAGEQIVALGVPVSHGLAVVEKVQRHARGVAREFVRLFLQDVWKPFADAGMPEDKLPEVRASLEQLRSIATDVLLGAFSLSMGNEVESAFGKELARTPRAKKKAG